MNIIYGISVCFEFILLKYFRNFNFGRQILAAEVSILAAEVMMKSYLGIWFRNSCRWQ